MKGRICYACFLCHLGIEKLFNFIEVKSSFLKPVTLSLSQRGPFRSTSATGASTGLVFSQRTYAPVASSLLPGLIVFSGRHTTTSPIRSSHILVGHCFFLCRYHYPWWPVSVFGLPSPGPTASRPLIFSKPYIFYGADGSGYSARIRKYVAEPSALRRYRDIN